MAVVGSPGSGKDILIQAINDLGAQHAEIVPKHTSRDRRQNDGDEMICANDNSYNLQACDIIYNNFDTKYGIDTGLIWRGLKRGVFQVLVVSNVAALNDLRSVFGKLLILVYVHSEIDPSEYRKSEMDFGNQDDYVEKRMLDYSNAFGIYKNNFISFNHVLLYTGANEDLYDQIFRLFRSYEKGL